jgi:predicted DNA binding CopG/RHH family protein
MNKNNNKEKMIHIRLDDTTHKRLKIEAVQEGTTIQRMVEDLILQKLSRSRTREIR